MLHYIDLHLQADPELPSHLLMSALFAHLHRGLVSIRSSQIAVTFPGYQTVLPTLGGTLRLSGPESELGRLMAQGWLRAMQGHVLFTAPALVPADAKWRHLRRVQAKSSPERLRRRQIRRHELTAAQAHELVPDSCAESLSLPFVTLSSASTGQSFKLFLRLSLPTAVAQAGEFNSYGLSNAATTPWF